MLKLKYPTNLKVQAITRRFQEANPFVNLH